MECIKFGKCKVKTIQVGDDCFVAVKNIGTALGVNNNTIKALVRQYLPKEMRFSRQYIGLDIPYDQAKLFTTIAGACRIILGSTHPDKYEVLDFLIERHDHLQDRLWTYQRKEPVPLDDSIPEHQEYLYFILKLKEPIVLSQKKVAYQYACLGWQPRTLKLSIKRFKKKHPGSTVILKMINNPLRMWEKARSIIVFQGMFFRINRGHEHILNIDQPEA